MASTFRILRPFSRSFLMRSQYQGSRTTLLPPPALFAFADDKNVGRANFFSKDDSRIFMSVFPDLVRELTFEGPHTVSMPSINLHMSKCIQYNVPHGKKSRGLTVLVTYKTLTPEEERTEENMRLAAIMGWCVEFLQAYFLVADDMMDQSSVRRGQECWHKKEDVGLLALNDTFMLESCVYRLLYLHFRDQPYYLDCVHLFLDFSRRTTLGQTLDMLTSGNGKPDLDTFDMKRYSSIVKFKTSYYSQYLPVALAMKMAGFNDDEVYRQARTILVEIGHYFQVQDDYFDCFGDPEVIGKVGTDIEDGKCSWLIVIALQRANKAQKELLKECYGSSDPEKVEKVKELYKELKIPKIFKNYEDESYESIQTHINQLSGGSQHRKLPPTLFTSFLNKVYKRKA